MAWRGPFLATAVAVAALAVAAVAAEEPAGQPTPAPAPAPMPDGTGESEWTISYRPIGALGGIAVLLGVLAALYFALGLAQHRHDWKPLVFGLFALGLGLLNATIQMAEACSTTAFKGVTNPPDLADAMAWSLCADVAWSLWQVSWSIGFALAGGLFTVILRWRNERFRKRQAEAAAEVDEEPGAN